MRIILARWTSKYGNVYFAARRFSSCASSRDSLITNGLLLGMREPSLQGSRCQGAIREWTYQHKYVSVVMKMGTKVISSS